MTEDIAELQNSGIDIICNRTRQNEYFIGARQLELAELKLLVDAVQAARFISPKKTKELINKLSDLAGPCQGELLKRSLFAEGKAKTENEKVFYSVDTLYTAIQAEKAVTFKYIEYTAEKKKIYKHKGQIYVLSPYDMVWSNDAYYVLGFSEHHGKVVKFRVDRMNSPAVSDKPYRPRPVEYNAAAFCDRVFPMYDGRNCMVELKCENSLMKAVIDRFGEDVQTQRLDCGHFMATVEVSVSPTFYAWVFIYGDQIEILTPKAVREAYREQLKSALKE